MKIRAVPTATMLLVLAGFLAPLLGGSLYNDATSLGPGPGAFLTSVFHGSDTPGLSNFIIALCVGSSLALTVFNNKVLQVPNPRLAMFLVAFFALLVLSLIPAENKTASLAELVNWLIYGIGFFAVISGIGRVKGPLAFCMAFVLGCTFLAIVGIHEWGLSKAVDPTWRIFAGWNNPNALAGILAPGFLLALMLTLQSKRAISLLFAFSTAIIGLALFLTQSRGGLLATSVGILLFVFLTLAHRDGGGETANFGATFGRLVGTVALCGFLIFGAVRSTQLGKGQLGGRLTSSGTSDQSTGFRKNLWRGAVSTMAGQPTGVGIGGYAIASTRSGLVTQTMLAHNSSLQLGVEASPLAPILLLGFIVGWFYKLVRGWPRDGKARLLLSGVLCGVVVICIDGVFESNLYFFGTGLIFFMLLGLGAQLAADSVAPEFNPIILRRLIGIGTSLVLLAVGYFGTVQSVKANARYAYAQHDAVNFDSNVQILRAIAPNDGETYFLASLISSAAEGQRLSDLQQAVKLAPSSKLYRQLAEAEAQIHGPASAEAVLAEGLRNDPNNLLTLHRLLAIQKANGELIAAKATAGRLVAVESLPYFRVRSIPEMVPLQTAEAHVFLAGQTSDSKAAADELLRALQIYGMYGRVTIANLISQLKKYSSTEAMQTSPEQAITELENGLAAGTQLEALQTKLNDAIGLQQTTTMIQGLREAKDAFEAALASSK